jgi:hypothetical protein
MKKGVMTKFVSMCIVCVMMCITLITPVAAANGSFSGSTGTMNALNGGQSAKWPISSGSVNTNAIVSSVTVNVSASFSSSDPFYLYVEHPDGYAAYKRVGSAGSYTFTEFNRDDPRGTWKVYIVNIPTKNGVSTATARMTVNYTY